MLRRALASLLLVLALGDQRALAAERQRVDVILVLAVDVSRSISDSKFELERRGYAQGLADPQVLRAIKEGVEGRIAVALVEWSDDFQQRVMVDWTIISDAHDAGGFADKLSEAPRSFYGRTAVGSAIDFCAKLIAAAPYESERRVIDVSGDGTSNGGASILAARDRAVEAGVTINGLVILTDPVGLPEYLVMHTNPPGGLAAYYRQNVIGGLGSFVMEANGFEAFGRALVAKLIREIS